MDTVSFIPLFCLLLQLFTPLLFLRFLFLPCYPLDLCSFRLYFFDWPSKVSLRTQELSNHSLVLRKSVNNQRWDPSVIEKVENTLFATVILSVSPESLLKTFGVITCHCLPLFQITVPRLNHNHMCWNVFKERARLLFFSHVVNLACTFHTITEATHHPTIVSAISPSHSLVRDLANNLVCYFPFVLVNHSSYFISKLACLLLNFSRERQWVD